MKKMATVFFGTHQFAVTILEGLLKSPFCEVELVITRPDRPVGRKQEMLPSPVKLLAQKSGLLIDQPTTLKSYQLPATSYLMASMSAILVTGLVDTPYIKNDLALFFWLLLALMVISHRPNQNLIQSQS